MSAEVTTVRPPTKRGRVHLVRQSYGTSDAGQLRATAACGRPVEGEPGTEIDAVNCAQCVATAMYQIATRKD